jgi:hypothetical protein
MAFLLLTEAASAAPLVGKLEYSGLVGVLLIAVGVLWRAYLKKDDQVQALIKEMLLHTDAVNQIPPSLDRLRTEVLAKVERCPLLGDRVGPPRAT